MDDDARGVYARLTDEGFDAFMSAVGDHLETLRHVFFDVVGKDTPAFRRVLGRLADACR